MASQAPRIRVVRARQRDRATSLLGFDPRFEPQDHEWRVDRLVLTVAGRWRATNAQNGFELFEQRLTDAYGPDWLLRPSASRYGVSVESRSNGPLTLNRLALKATGCSERDGKLTLELAVNPTRTLASLIVRFGSMPDFRARLVRMDALMFFAPPPAGALPPSLDGRSNYLPDQPDLRAILGSDPFFAFMPIFLQQLHRLLDRVLSENNQSSEFDASEQVFGIAGDTVRLDWGSVRVPQIETYFERFHRQAEAAVRTAGAAIIDGDTETTLRLYPGEHMLGRTADSFGSGSI